MDTKTLLEIKTNFLSGDVKKAMDELKEIVENGKVEEGKFIGENIDVWTRKILETFKKHNLEVDLLYHFESDKSYIAIMLDVDYIGRVKTSWEKDNKVFLLLP